MQTSIHFFMKEKVYHNCMIDFKARRADLLQCMENFYAVKVFCGKLTVKYHKKKMFDTLVVVHELILPRFTIRSPHVEVVIIDFLGKLVIFIVNCFDRLKLR